MNYKDKIRDFNKRWDIQDSLTHEEEFEKFKNRVLNLFKNIDNVITTEGGVQFCQVLGVRQKSVEEFFGEDHPDNGIYKTLKSESNEKRFYLLLEIIFTLPFRGIDYFTKFPISPSRNTLIEGLNQAIDLSDVNVKLIVRNREVILVPAGEKFLDSNLVDRVLSFLDEKSESHFVESLKFYMKAKPKNSIKSSESLRRSLEEFLRFKLNNGKGLAANIKELMVKVKDDRRDPAIRNIIFQTFSYLDQYFNENSKHNDGDISKAENEFLIYQTCVLMRYVNEEVK